MSTQDNNPYALSDEAWQAAKDAGRSSDIRHYFDDRTSGLRRTVEAAARVAVRALQAQVEDVGVRAARQNNWCAEFGRVMWRMFPAGPLDGSEWRDSDGVDCSGHEWRDSDGYDRNGLNHSGRDREGYDRDGFDVRGYNREGKDVEGFMADDPARYRYRYIRSYGMYDRDGYGPGPDGTVFPNLSRRTLAEWASEGTDPFRYDRDGYDRDGFAASNGRDRDGYDRDGYDRDGRDGRGRDGYDRAGFKIHPDGDRYIHRNGTECDDHGFDRYGYHTETGSQRDPQGFNVAGLDRDGNPRPVASVTDATAA